MTQDVSFLTLPDRKLAYQQRIATPENRARPGVLFLGGFASDMTGTKASFLDQQCAESGLSYTRFDYRGHGESSARFEDGCIGDWADDALQVCDRLTQGPLIVVGSSMGGWIGLLLALARLERVVGFVGIAAAPDFTEDMILPELSQEQQEQLTTDGKTWTYGTTPGDGLPITQRLIDDGKQHLLLRQPITLNVPVRLLQGMQDADVPWQWALKIAEKVTSPDVRTTLIKDGDHRLSRPQDLTLLWQGVLALT